MLKKKFETLGRAFSNGKIFPNLLEHMKCSLMLLDGG